MTTLPRPDPDRRAADSDSGAAQPLQLPLSDVRHLAGPRDARAGAGGRRPLAAASGGTPACDASMLTGGEALMHRGLWELCGLLREAAHRHHPAVYRAARSSGTRTSRESRATSVIVSLDGPPPCTTAFAACPRAFERLAAGVRAVRAARPEMSITARCTVQHANCRHLRDTVAAAPRDRARRHQLSRRGCVERSVRPAGRLGRRPCAAGGARRGRPAALAAELDALERDGSAFAGRLHRRAPDKLWRELHQHSPPCSA